MLREMSNAKEPGGSWTLLTGHGRVLAEIASNPGARVRDISAVVGLTERTVQAIVSDLDEAGYITRTRTGRRTIYAVRPDRPFRHAAQDGLRIGALLAALARPGDRGSEPAALPADASAGHAPARPDGPPRPEQPRG
jgi:hypothetical protein